MENQLFGRTPKKHLRKAQKRSNAYFHKVSAIHKNRRVVQKKGRKGSQNGPPRSSQKADPRNRREGPFDTRVRILDTFWPPRHRFSTIRAGWKNAKTCIAKKAIFGALSEASSGPRRNHYNYWRFHIFRAQKGPRGGPKMGNFKRPRRHLGAPRKQLRQNMFRASNPSVGLYPLIVV